MDTIEVNGTEGVMDQDQIEVTSNGVVAEEPTQNVEDDANSAPTYAEAFPPLGGGAKPEEPVSSTWGKSSSVKKAGPAKKKAPIQSSAISTVLKVPYEERRYKNLMPVIGEGVRQNEAIKEVMQKTGTQIEVSVTKDQSLTIMLSGKRDSVALARSQILRALQSQGSMEIEIPKEHHRFILGRGGKRLQELELMTATKINIPRDSDIIRIVGSKEGMDRAKHEMQLVSDEQAKLGFERVEVPKIYHPFICGPNNATAKEIANKTGARINIPPPSVDKDELTVAGEKEGVVAAVKMINDLYKLKEKKTKTVTVEIKKAQHRYVIGPRGQGLQDVLAATGVSVEVPSADVDSETITLRGEPDKLGSALTLVYDKANSVVASEVHAPLWLHRFIIGRKGQNIKKITQDLEKLHIEFIEDKDMILLEGPPEEVQQAETLLETSINELKNTMSFEDVEVDPKWHRHIIGKAGANITRIKNETGTSINIPSDTEKSNIIHIEGSPDGVAAAKEEILAMAAKFGNERSKDIIIEQRFHKNIIGQKGEKVREIREKFGEVQISFPEAGAKSDIVTLRGPKDQVDQCYSFLKKLATDLVASNFRLEVPIFKKFHGNVIGRNGANIKKIKEETLCSIDIPTENANSDIITITGYKEQCEKARKMILAVQSELANVVTKDVNIAQNLHTSMIGSGGKLIQSIMTECGDVHIHFPPEGKKSDIITIRGAKEDVEKAEVQLLKLADERLENSFTAEVTAKPEHHRFLIGKAGANIRQVREKTGARIIFPTNRDENKELITIIGKKEAVEEAKVELESKIADLNNIVEGDVDIECKHHKHFVARRAQVLRDLADEYGGVTVSFPREPNVTKVTIKGAKECVESAKKRILEIVDDLEAMVEMKCVIEQKHHRAVLGQKGSHVQGITGRFNVQIKFPERKNENASETAAVPVTPTTPEAAEPAEPVTAETTAEVDATDAAEPTEKKCDIIMVSGRKENVEQAITELKALVPISDTVEVPFDNHRFIIGQKGAGIRKMMDEFDVNISVPSSEKQSDTIIVTGTVKNVEAAIEALKNKNGEIEAENNERKLRQFELVIEVSMEHHTKLIGRKGAVINKFRDDYQVNIQVPQADKQSNEIKLVGYEANCNKAKEAIMAMIGEIESQTTLEIQIDQRIHSRIIGQKGRSVRKVMDMFKVDIRFPRGNDPNLVLISGAEDACEECKEHLLMLEEEYMDDVRERESERDLMSSYIRDSGRGRGSHDPPQAKEYVVKDAPWAQTEADFPTLGGAPAAKAPGKAWGSWGQ